MPNNENQIFAGLDEALSKTAAEENETDEYLKNGLIPAVKDLKDLASKLTRVVADIEISAGELDNPDREVKDVLVSVKGLMDNKSEIDACSKELKALAEKFLDIFQIDEKSRQAYFESL